MIVCGLIGHPLGHSYSSLIHEYLGHELLLDLKYSLFDVEKDLDKAIEGAYALGVTGLNVTVPYKTRCMESLCGADENAAQIGAVNTLVRTEKGFVGYNTDSIGFSCELDRMQMNPEGKTFLVIGAGGAARAICFTLLRRNAGKLYILNRSLERAEKLATDLRDRFETEIRVFDDEKKIPQETFYAIQTTSVGMSPNTNESPVSREFCERIIKAIDIIYNPKQTLFMSYCRESANGLFMLVMQAVKSFEKWNNVTVSEELIEKTFAYLEEKVYG